MAEKIAAKVLAEWRVSNTPFEQRYYPVKGVKPVEFDPEEFEVVDRTTRDGRDFQMVKVEVEGESRPFTFFIRGDVEIDTASVVKIRKYEVLEDFPSSNGKTIPAGTTKWYAEQ